MAPDFNRKTYVKPGETVRMELAFSEVCMHMRVAGKVMNVRLLDHTYPAAQILRDDGTEYSFPIGTGEAGFYQDDGGYYYYPVV